MSDFAEYTLLFGMLAAAGVAIIFDVKVEIWCERWLERILIQPLTSESPGRLTSSKRKETA